eukprot:1277408-Pyramimonas_sp.AAC.1
MFIGGKARIVVPDSGATMTRRAGVLRDDMPPDAVAIRELFEVFSGREVEGPAGPDACCVCSGPLAPSPDLLALAPD